MTTSSFFKTWATVSEALTKGVKSGRLLRSMGVGTATIKDVASPEVVDLAAILQVARLLQLLAGDFPGHVKMTAQFIDTPGLEIKTNGGPLFAEFNGQGQADIAKTDDGDTNVV